MNRTYTEIVKNYRLWLDTLGFSDGVVYELPGRINYFFEWLENKGISKINQLNQTHINQYFTYLEQRPNQRQNKKALSVSHLNHNFDAIDKLLEFLHQHGLNTAPTPTGYRIKQDQAERIRKIQPLTQQEIKTLYNTIENAYPNFEYTHRQAKHHQLKLIFTLYYACGLRRTEGANLTIKDINFENKTIFIKSGKGYKDRIIPMSKGIYTHLQDYIYNYRHSLHLSHTRLFITQANDQYKALKHLQNICSDPKIRAKHITLHILRHSIATHLLQNGMSVENISKFLGHNSLESTQIYTHLI
jgi:integrase/recombinase XerD